MLGGGYTVLPPGEGRPKAKAAALKALEIDPELSEAYAALALVKHEYEWDWVGAEKEFRRAIELNPSYASAHQWYGEYLVTVARPEEAVVEMERARKADPLSLIIQALAGWCLDAAGRREEAVDHLRRTLEMDPGFDRSHFILGIVYQDQGRFPEAVQEFQTAVTLSGDAPKYRAFLIHAYAGGGQRDKAAKLFVELKDSPKGRYISPVDLAMVHVGLGEKEQALEWLERAYQERSSDMIYLKTGRFWAPLRGDPRFQDLLRRMNFPEE
jgi:Tfp pilus assembly protein PilF